MNKKRMESGADQAAPEGERARKLIWDGITSTEALTEEGAKVRHQLADWSKQYRWPQVLHLLSEWPELVNATRPGGVSGYAPLHQAAHGGAPLEVVTALLRYGAFRTLKDAQGERAVDIAQAHGHKHLLPVLDPVYEQQVPTAILSRIQEHFHATIHDRAGELVERHRLRLPELEPLLEYREARFWFAVPGMYEGFHYWLADDGARAKLISESWCRVVGGSEQRHEITEQGSVLVEEGFV